MAGVDAGTEKEGVHVPKVLRETAWPSMLNAKALAGASPATTVEPGATGPAAAVELKTGVNAVDPLFVSA